MSRTPGPWKVAPGGFVDAPIGHGRICQLWNKFEEDFHSAKETEANARLIAAAPELLEALKSCRETVEMVARSKTSPAGFFDTDEEHQRAIEEFPPLKALLAALAKAGTL